MHASFETAPFTVIKSSCGPSVLRSSVILVLGKQKQRDCYKFEVSLVYTVIPSQLGLCNKIVSPLTSKDNSGCNI